MLNYVFSYLLALGQRLSGYKSTGIHDRRNHSQAMTCLTFKLPYCYPGKELILGRLTPVLYLPCICLG